MFSFTADLDRKIYQRIAVPPHLSLLRDRLQMHPKLKAVLDHAGKPDIAGGDYDEWAADQGQFTSTSARTS
jgi:predicted TIM-barrel fold metal-dependent hydrolase